nr:hypothetical protein [Odoribacter laneus]
MNTYGTAGMSRCIYKINIKRIGMKMIVYLFRDDIDRVNVMIFFRIVV